MLAWSRRRLCVQEQHLPWSVRDSIRCTVVWRIPCETLMLQFVEDNIGGVVFIRS